MVKGCKTNVKGCKHNKHKKPPCGKTIYDTLPHNNLGMLYNP